MDQRQFKEFEDYQDFTDNWFEGLQESVNLNSNRKENECTNIVKSSTNRSIN